MLNLTVMLIHSLLQMVSALPGSSNPSSFSPLHPLHPRCHFGQPCWPSASVWSSFNASISGRLIASHPSADPCHDPHYSVDLCAAAHANWTSSDWRTSQVGAYAGILWEVGSGSCFPDTSEQQKCDQGMVAELSVDARSVEDVQAAVRFAGQHDLYLVVKNTGHDHLGRSSGAGSFAIWTHNMKGRQWLRSFVPHGAPKSCKGVPAVTLQPGEQWLDVYRDADAHNVTIVGGSARTVGTSGGYLLGGGHSPFAHFYGLAADNLLEATIVTPSGEHLTLNEYTDRDYFWAIRGGGGSNWGVLTSVTYKTHPLPTAIQVAVAQFNVSTAQQFRSIMSTILKTLPEITAAGYTGYGDTDLSAKTIGLIFLQPNGTDTALESLAPLAALALNPETGVSGLFANSTFPTWLDYTDYFLKDPNVATNVQDGSRLMTPDVLVNKTDEVLDVIMEYADMGAGFNFSKVHRCYLDLLNLLT